MSAPTGAPPRLFHPCLAGKLTTRACAVLFAVCVLLLRGSQLRDVRGRGRAVASHAHLRIRPLCPPVPEETHAVRKRGAVLAVCANVCALPHSPPVPRPSVTRARLRGSALDVRKAPQPSDIIWENLGVTTCSRFFRTLLTFTVTVLLLGLSIVLVFLAEASAAPSGHQVGGVRSGAKARALTRALRPACACACRTKSAKRSSSSRRPTAPACLTSRTRRWSCKT